jgi:AraC family transcriptional regulator
MRDSARLTLVRRFIDEHLSEDLPLARIAEAAGLSQSHLSFLFKQQYGISIHRYVLRRRVDAASELLLCGIGFSEAAQRAGFSDQSHMTRCMRRFTGLTPTRLLALSSF